MKFNCITSEAAAEAYETTESVFSAVLSEVRELSKKKPDAILTAAKVRMVNRMLVDLLGFLEREPEAKYLEPLDEDALPQISDALLHMAQFRAALDAFRSRYTVKLDGEELWVTPENLAEWEAEGVFDDEDDEDD